MLGFEITSIEENWIFLRHDYRDELDGFIMLMKSIESELDGHIIQMDGDDIQYMIQRDPYHLIFRWDSSFGMAVIVENMADMETVIGMLQYHFNKLDH